MFSDEDAEFLQDQPVEESSGNSQLEDINNIVAWVSWNSTICSVLCHSFLY